MVDAESVPLSLLPTAHCPGIQQYKFMLLNTFRICRKATSLSTGHYRTGIQTPEGVIALTLDTRFREALLCLQNETAYCFPFGNLKSELNSSRENSPTMSHQVLPSLQ